MDLQIQTDASANVPTTNLTTVSNGKATTSLVLGIIGMLAWIIPLFGLPITVVGLILGIKGLPTVKHTRAVVGIVLCSIGLLFTIINASIGAYLGATGQNEIVNELLEE